jgi:hypothetical protein
VPEPCKGCFVRPSGLPNGTDRARQRPIDTPGRRRYRSQGRFREARGRSPDESPARLLPEYPKRAKPKGASSGWCTNPAPAARDSRKGQSPEAEARWAGPLLQQREYRRAKRHVGPSPRKRGGYLPRGESSEGRIPRAPPV